MSLSLRDGVAVLTIDNPPVNALGPQSIAPLVQALEEAQADRAVRALVLVGAGGAFSGGADMRGFAGARSGPTIRELIERLEASAKPVVAAIEGNCLGGGLEVALGCDYRVAGPTARLGFAEIKRGLLPGAGGTQRAPRLAGVEAALELIVGGESIGAERARQIGLVDELAGAGEVLEVALRLARGLTAGTRRRASELTVSGGADALAAARRKAAPEARGGLAEQRAIDCVEDAVTLPFEEGMRRERERFVELLGSEQSKARIHLFFAEREAAKLPDGSSAPKWSARSAVVIGGGTMGTGIAMACANAGISVRVVEVQPAQLERARATISGNYAATVKKGKLAQAEMDARLGRIGFAESLDAAADVDLVIEAVFEDMAVKQDVFRQLDRIARPGTILATNTSTLDVDAIAAVTGAAAGRGRAALLQPGQRDEAARDRARRTDLGRDARARAGAGQATRQGRGRLGQLRRLHRQPHALPVPPRGRVRAWKRALRRSGSTASSRASASRWARSRCPIWPASTSAGASASGATPSGRRSGATRPSPTRCASWAASARRPAPATTATRTAARRSPTRWSRRSPRTSAAANGVARHEMSDDEIVARCMYPLVNEAARILAEGIAARPGDIDVVYVYGYGFPAFRGGPLRWADAIGLRKLVDDMLAFEQTYGEVWEPAPLLRELADAGGTFGAWKRAQAPTRGGARACVRPSSSRPPAPRSARRRAARSTTPTAPTWRRT